MTEHHTIQLESFSTSLHGTNILYPLPANTPSSRYPPFMEWIQKLREPFRKRIRLSHPSFHLSKHLQLAYDTSFHVKDTQDWTLILTYMTYAPKPLLVVVEDISIPDGLWQKINRSITLLHITSSPVVRLHPYDSIFFSSVEDVPSSYMEYTHKIIQAVYRPSYTIKEHKEILQELRVAKAGMAWTRIDESTTQGAIYWYDPVSTPSGERITSTEMRVVLEWLAEQCRTPDVS